MRRSPPTVYLGEGANPEIAEAIKRGGGWLTTDIEDAEAVVWVGGDIVQLRRFVRTGIEWLQLPSAGVEEYVTSGLVSGSHTTTCAGPAYSANVAEHALALLLACARRLPEFSRGGHWLKLDIRRLTGSTVAIVGCGRIGRSLIELLKPFQVRVLAVTRAGGPVDDAALTFASDELTRVLPEADFVVIAAPASPETIGLIGREQFQQMRRTAYLVNVARGSLVVTSALIEAIANGVIAGAALDVTDPEPLPADHDLWDSPNVIVTPHVANPEEWDMAELAPLVEENVRRFRTGAQLLGIVDPAKGY